VTTRAVLASVAIALVAGIAGGALALALRGDGDAKTVVTTVVRGDGSVSTGGFDPVAIYANARHGVVTIEAVFGPDDTEAGSGFVVDARHGLIVTASHVVARTQSGGAPPSVATAVYVVLDDGTRVDAKLLGYDLFEDTAMVRADPDHLGLRALPLGRARLLRVGDPVAAIGSPFENRASLSTGIVSQLDRQITAPGVCGYRTTGAIQTDAAVNPGNSGGPLLNAGGQVVGMVTAVARGPDARGGVSYAVPIEAVKRSYLAIAAGKHVPYASLGVAAATVTPALADALHFSVQHGALVRQLIPGGAAARAGIRAGVQTEQVAGDTYPRDGDIIVAVGATPVAGFRDLDRAVATHRAGDRVVLRVVRRDGKHALTVRLQSRPASFTNCA
jgi:S1-C subfamily serine protease